MIFLFLFNYYFGYHSQEWRDAKGEKSELSWINNNNTQNVFISKMSIFPL